MSDNAYTNEDLKTMQAWDLNRKIQVAQTRIMEWYMKHDNKCYVSFSGGKDSTVLADMAAKVCKMLGCKLVLWFSDTGLEYPEVREHVKSFPKYIEDKYGIEVELIMDYPKFTRGEKKGKRMSFKYIIEHYGYPLISKEQSQYINECKYTKSDSLRNTRLNGNKNGSGKISNKWQFLLDAPFDVTHKCCYFMKKQPAQKFNKNSGLFPIIGTMADESKLREKAWLKYGCNSFNSKTPNSKPMSVWLEQDVLEYLKKYKLPYPSVYGNIIVDENGKLKTTGCDRTGCVFCGFGCHLEKEPNKFQRLKQTHPKLWEYCMKPWDEGGLGMKEVLDYISIKSE